MMEVSIKRWHDLCNVVGLSINKTPDILGLHQCSFQVMCLLDSSLFFSEQILPQVYLHKQPGRTLASATEAWRSLQSFCPHISRQRSLHGSLCRSLGTFGSWSHRCFLGFALSLGLGLWPTHLRALVLSAGIFLEVGVSNVGKSAELATATLWDLGLDFCGLHLGLASLSRCTHGLGIVLHLLQVLLTVLSGKAHVLWEFGIISLKRIVSLFGEHFDAVSVPFSDCMVLNVAMSAPKPWLPKCLGLSGKTHWTGS